MPVETKGESTLRRATGILMPLAGAVAVGAIACGGPNAFPALSIPIAAEFATGRTLAVTPWTLFLTTTAVASPFLGRAFDRWSDRLLLTAAMALLAAGWIGVAVAPNIAVVILAFGLFQALGVQLVFIGISTAVARRYPGASGLALGSAYAGVGVGIAIALWVAAALIASVGWRGAAIAFAASTSIAFPFIWLMTSSPAVLVAPANLQAQPVGWAAASKPPSLRSVIRRGQFWALFAGATAIGAFDEGFFQSFVPHAVKTGFGIEFASLALGLQSIGWVVGQVVGGALSDRFGRKRVGAVAAGLVIVGITLAFAVTPAWAGVALLALVADGLGTGTTIAVRSAAFGDIYRGAHFGSIFGLLAVAYPIGGVIGVYAAAVASDSVGSYAPFVALAVIAAGVWAVILWRAGPPSRHATSPVRSAEER